MSTHDAAIAANRFGMGARPGELAGIDDPRGWLDAQLHGNAPLGQFKSLPSSRDYRAARVRLSARTVDAAQRADAPQSGAGNAAMATTMNADDDVVEKVKMSFRKVFGQDQLAEIAARYRSATTTDTGFVERLVHFWSNHFAISIDKRQAALYAAPMEREAIRPHVLGRFENLLQGGIDEVASTACNDARCGFRTRSEW